ncbi:hypothetical protein Hanom_Chr11g00995621 [Helianthus anomalus]
MVFSNPSCQKLFLQESASAFCENLIFSGVVEKVTDPFSVSDENHFFASGI